MQRDLRESAMASLPPRHRNALLCVMALVLFAGCEPRATDTTPAAATPAPPVEVAAPAPPPFDPVTMDPPADAAHPASMAGLLLPVEGVTVNGRIYEAAGAGPHPTLLMLHGFPGSELNLDLAQAVRRAGWNVVMFHYRGAWGSGGEFSLHHVLADAQAVLDAIRAPGFASAHRIDPARVAVFGHSMGGFVALMTGAARSELRCTVSVAGANFLALVAGIADPSIAAAAAERFQSWGTGPIANMSGERMVAEVAGSAADFDLEPRMRSLADRPLLLVAGNADVVTMPAQNHEPQLAWLRAAGATRVQELRLDADHAFSGSRIALSRAVIEFLQGNCR
jgi:pimeloyl-ACP methyl ester carboxylesterase